MTSNEVDQVSWNREERCVCAIARVNQVVRILTLYEASSRSVTMNLWYNSGVARGGGFGGSSPPIAQTKCIS